MTDKFEEIVDNLKQPSHWVRLPFMLAFGFVLYLIFVPVVLVVMAAQILFALLTGETNRNLRGLGAVVQQYVSQIVNYITYNSDQRPYPFSDFPIEGFEAESETETAASTDPAKSQKAKKPSADASAKGAPKKAKKAAMKSKAGMGNSESAAPKKVAKKATKKKAPVKKKSAETTEAPATTEASSEEKRTSADDS